MPYADLNGTRMHYTDTEGTGDTIVFAHGLLFSGAMFDAQIAHFRGKYRCITFDHRGQGHSDVPDDGYDMDTLAEDAAALIKQLGLGPCHFVGLSMGGFVGMRLAARHPDLLKSLTLLDTSADPEPSENIPKYRLLNFVARWIGHWACHADFVRADLPNRPSTRRGKKSWVKAIVGNDRIGITRALSGVITRDGCADLLGQIKMPVSIGVGAEDLATIPPNSEAIQAAITGSQLTVFEGAGHSASIETPDQVNTLITQTIER